MEISALTIKIIILMIPGAIASVLIDKLTAHKEWKPFRFVLNAIILGLISYIVYQQVQNLFILVHNIFQSDSQWEYPDLKVWSSFDDGITIPYIEVTLASISAILVGVIGTALENYRIIYRLGKRFHLSNKYGHQNLYSYFLNQKDTSYVYIRNLAADLVYSGCIETFSETEEISEIVLSEASVYTTSTGVLLYEIPKIYLSFAKNSIVIESAIINPVSNGQEENNNTAQNSETGT